MEDSNRNRDFRLAQRRKKDEFYTSLRDIELELTHHEEQFRNKTVYCNCDDPRESNFFCYFYDNFHRLGLKKLVTTSYCGQDETRFGRGRSGRAVRLEYTGQQRSGGTADIDDLISPLEGDGDFRSGESVELLRSADIVVTNPPFSLLREYVAQLMEHNKKFLILGNLNALTYSSIFPLFQEGRMWYGPSIRSGDREFRVPDDYPLQSAGSRVDPDGTKYIRVKGVRWFTNMDFPERHVDMELERKFNPADYPTYANFDAIDVSRTRDIPMDYPGLMGVPITFLDKHSPHQFELVGSSRTLGTPMAAIAERGTFSPGGPRFYLPNGDGTYRRLYDRIVIKNKMLA